ncbi:flagellar protein, FliL [Candidatus Methanosphaera massiliense]|jgi:cytoskeletal protein RodZ|uniref:flagellar protein, FliL n=1 Tax=Methanosphaera TaxID=2316 RepID=UPI002380A76A|nr:flagellar protein, FliL [Candidatus Methanosphaera massiliense]MDE4079017.1 flagellar protein, FliL [Candidatus Methanosphaera massiliense]MDY2745183.1 flagellar protein, FliL [Methanosphaera sp.]
MRDKPVLLLLVIVIIVIIGAVSAFSLYQPENNTTNNTTVNITNNTTNITNNTTSNDTPSSSSSDSSSSNSNNGPSVVSTHDEENYQAGDGSHYKQVEYSDGNFRQYDYNGKLIGSSYDSDQKYLPSME